MIEFTQAQVIGVGVSKDGFPITLMRRMSASLVQEFYRAELRVVPIWRSEVTHLWIEQTTIGFLSTVNQVTENNYLDASGAIYMVTYPRRDCERGVTFVGFWKETTFMIDLMDIDESDQYLEQQGVPAP